MMNNYVLSEISLSKLTCSVCKKPLSHFPIYNSIKGGSSCGRCEAPRNGYRNEIFEELAKIVEFPCCYKRNGCLEILLPKNVANHELRCKFQKFTCPFKFGPLKGKLDILSIKGRKSCFWIGFADDFLEHTKNMHPRVVTDNCFKTSICDEIKLMPYLDRLYLVNYIAMCNEIMCNVKEFGYKSVDDNLHYKITFEDSEKQFSHSVFFDLNATFSILKSDLNDLLRNPPEIIASIEILQKQPVDVSQSVTKNVNAELLKHFECPVCMDYMIGPIYLCVQGHSICQPCRDQVTACPTCRSHIQTTRNYTLETVISDTEFPCKYDKCLFVGKGRVIKKHQETCNFIETDCPLKELDGCKKKLVYADLSDHIYKEHNKHWYKGDIISYLLAIDEEYEEVFFLKYCLKLFRLNFSYRNKLFTFVVKLMDSSEESSKFRFVVEILDTTDNTNRLCCSKNLKGKEQAIKIHFDSIEHLITESFNFRMFVQEN